MNIRYLLSTLMGVWLLAACSTPKNVVYFEDLNQNAEKRIDIELPEIPISYDDKLIIHVSAIDPATVAPFNLPLTTSMQPGSTMVNTTPTIQCYQVMSDGTINFPVLGKIKVEGMTQYQLADDLTQRISQYAENPIVDVQFSKSSIIVIGEVARPGLQEFSQNRYSILDALGTAGDLTISGRRDNILLIREENGKRTTHHFDLTRSDFLESPYFYLRQHDVIYVQPNETRIKDSQYSQGKQYSISVISAIVSTVSVICSLILAVSY